MDKITIIGGGNMGRAIAIALKNTGNNEIIVTKRDISEIHYLREQKIVVTNDNVSAIRQSKYIIIAVKPKHFLSLFNEIKSILNEEHIIISIIAGLTIDEIQNHLNKGIGVFRAMPNISVEVNKSMTCICYNSISKLQQQHLVKDLFNRIGKSIFIDEKFMNAATVLSGSGIAFAMRYIRASMQAGIQMGFSVFESQLITTQTIMGAVELLSSKKSHPEIEIDKVATPNGCTIEGLIDMEHNGFSSALIKGMLKGWDKLNS